MNLAIKSMNKIADLNESTVQVIVALQSTAKRLRLRNIKAKYVLVATFENFC